MNNYQNFGMSSPDWSTGRMAYDFGNGGYMPNYGWFQQNNFYGNQNPPHPLQVAFPVGHEPQQHMIQVKQEEPEYVDEAINHHFPDPFEEALLDMMPSGNQPLPVLQHDDLMILDKNHQWVPATTLQPMTYRVKNEPPSPYSQYDSTSQFSMASNFGGPSTSFATFPPAHSHPVHSRLAPSKNITMSMSDLTSSSRSNRRRNITKEQKMFFLAHVDEGDFQLKRSAAVSRLLTRMSFHPDWEKFKDFFTKEKTTSQFNQLGGHYRNNQEYYREIMNF